MSALVVSNIKSFIRISRKLEDIGISNIHFYNSMNGSPDIPMLSLIPFIDLVVVDGSAGSCPYMKKVREEAEARHIYVVSDECLDNLRHSEGCQMN